VFAGADDLAQMMVDGMRISLNARLFAAFFRGFIKSLLLCDNQLM